NLRWSDVPTELENSFNHLIQLNNVQKIKKINVDVEICS
uniref:Uncharacterized protein n=1 Tax=Acrobeloides nanus TaxID=290746 RepID=A0A914D0L9_9BILA